MFKNYIKLTFILFLFSCGKDVVIIEEPTPNEDNDVLFEVNLVGFTTDEQRVYLPEVKLSVDGNEFESDASSFFHVEKLLIGQKGKVVQLEKEGYLPAFHRIQNHNSLEDVVLNLELYKEPVPQEIGNSGGSIEEEGSTLKVGADVFSSDTRILFSSKTGSGKSIGNSDVFYFGEKPEYLIRESSYYVEGDAPIKPGKMLSISTQATGFVTSNISNLSVFHFDEVALRWKQKDISIEQSGNRIEFLIGAYGWWTIAERVPAKYASLNLKQLDGSLVKNAEMQISFVESEFNQTTYYSSKSGSVSAFFPTGKSIFVGLDNGRYMQTMKDGFASGQSEMDINFDDLVQQEFSGKAFTCDFEAAEGYVAILSDGQHKVKEINGGQFDVEAFQEDEQVKLQFYTQEYEYINSRTVEVESLDAGVNNFLSCGDLSDKLTVLNGTDLFEGFENCRVKERPNETVIIGENSVENVFLLSFEGTKEGVYEGLIYFPELTDNEVKSQVMINIVLYDKTENKVGGFIKTENISTSEEITISFIGDIE